MTSPSAMAAPHSSLDDAKRAARAEALVRRAGLNPALGEALAAHTLANMSLSDGPVAGFWPLDGEIDIRPLLTGLHDRGHPVLLPVTPRRGNPLRFRRWAPGATLVAERYGTFCPAPDAPEAIPRTLFVPLLAFDRTGRRLGYGGGFYDRTLAGLPGAVAIGCAFAAQELDEVPAGEYDVRLHAVATERGIILCERR